MSGVIAAGLKERVGVDDARVLRRLAQPAVSARSSADPAGVGVLDRLCVGIAAALEDRESFRFETIASADGALRSRWAAA